MAASQPLARRCPACDSDFMVNARSRGMLEDVYFVLGGELCRCQNCEVRHAYFGRFTLPLGRTHPAANANATIDMRLVAIAILGGIIACLAIALFTLRHFRRWPF